MKGSGIRRLLFIVVLIAAIACIGLGFYKAWGAFTAFDETILKEKDSQFYSLMRSDDINIGTSIDSFVREADTFFRREKLNQYRKEWISSGRKDASVLREYFAQNTISGNPVYGDAILLYKDKQILSAEGGRKYTFLTESDDAGLMMAVSDDGRYYLAHEFDAGGKVRYVALLDLEKLYINVLGENSDRDLILMDSSSTVIIHREGDVVMITPVGEVPEGNIAKCRDYMLSCQEEQSSGGTMIELTDEDGTEYTARIVVMPSMGTDNAEFALGITANYEQTIRPSRDAAGKILIYGVITIAGIVVIIFMLLLIRRESLQSRSELEILRKRNEAMEELNQNMLALTHHQRLETIGTMTASIAHDFNNLLTPIMGYSMMAMEMLPEDQAEIQEYLMEVYNASVKAKDMVTRLADLTKKGKEENFTELDPEKIIENSLKVTLPAKPKTVEVKVRFRSHGRKMRGDATQISQLVMNITLNAYDEMRERGGSLYVSTAIEDNRIAMRFRDTGRGMDAETVAKIFDPFYTTKESGKGTGLGLAIVAQIAETHGGKVYVDSAPGEGTEFRITFPMLGEQPEQFPDATIQIDAGELREMLRKEERERRAAMKGGQNDVREYRKQ